MGDLLAKRQCVIHACFLVEHFLRQRAGSGGTPAGQGTSIILRTLIHCRRGFSIYG